MGGDDRGDLLDIQALQVGEGIAVLVAAINQGGRAVGGLNEDTGTSLERFAAAAPLAYITTPNRLTLAPPGAEKSDNPWHLREYTLAEYRALLEPHFSRVEVLERFHAGKLRIHEQAVRLGLDRVHRALRVTKPFYDRFVPAISSADFKVTGAGELDGALDFLAVCHA